MAEALVTAAAIISNQYSGGACFLGLLRIEPIEALEDVHDAGNGRVTGPVTDRGDLR